MNASDLMMNASDLMMNAGDFVMKASDFVMSARDVVMNSRNFVMNARNIVLSAVLSAVMLGSCSSTHKSSGNASVENDTVTVVRKFDGDSAYAFVKAQCDFGARVPNSVAHRRCGDYLIDKLKSYGANVIVQSPVLTAFDGTKLNARNIIGEFAPENTRRILLLAHWDSRPWADSDKNPENHSKPVMGANDGASGVGVLLEMARNFGETLPGVGVDILLVDAEDWGDNNGVSSDPDNSWALGTQYWASNPHRAGYRPLYGILLDMVGARGSCFTHEYFSLQYASAVVKEVWKMAEKSGYGDYFVNTRGGAITDDHVFVNRAGIPTIDIIAMDVTSETGFFPQWHTTDDTMEHIDPTVLKAVGQTLLNLIYSY